MSETTGTTTNNSAVKGLVGALALLIGLPLACEYRVHKERQETQAICRRAIERNYSVSADKAQQDIEAQRKWEDR